MATEGFSGGLLAIQIGMHGALNVLETPTMGFRPPVPDEIHLRC